MAEDVDPLAAGALVLAGLIVGREIVRRRSFASGVLVGGLGVAAVAAAARSQSVGVLARHTATTALDVACAQFIEDARRTDEESDDLIDLTEQTPGVFA